MKLPTQSGIAVGVGIAVSLFAAGCSRTGRDTTAADRSSETSSGYADRLSSTAPSSADKDFAMKAAQGGMAEVEMGNLAIQRGSSSSVKDFGRKLIDDHTKGNNDLKEVASREGISLPMDMSSKQHQSIDKLSKLSGSQFDKEFAKMSVDDHKDDISEFEKEANSGDNQSVKNFAASTLPTLRDHLSMAQNIEDSQKK